MRAAGLTTAAIFLAAGTASAMAANQLSPSEIQKIFGTGRPFSATSASGSSSYWFTFKPDGAAMAVPKGRKTGAGGQWRLSRNGYCSKWGTSPEHCYLIDKSSTGYDVRSSGGTLIARFALETPGTASTTAATASTSGGGRYRDGTYTGPTVDAYYGLMQIQAIVKNGRLDSIRVLKYPNDRRTSIFINRRALPQLRNEVIRAQSARVNIVSGATLSSRAFIRSLGSAMQQAGS